jgi:glycosyltransferase involved in cell wall biosynthesis
MRLLVLTEYFPAGEHEGITGGVEARALHLFRELARRHEVTMLCSYQGGDQPRRATVAGIDVRRVGPVHPYSNDGHVATRFGYAAAALAEGLRDGAFDLVEGFSYVTYPAASTIGRLRRRPAVATFHESWSFDEWVRLKGALTGTLGHVWVRGALALGFARYVAVSEATRQQIVAQGVSAEQVAVVHNGVDLDLLARIGGEAPARPSVSTSVRLIASKRADLLVRAVARLRERLPDVALTIQGEGVERAALEALVAQLGLVGNVSFVGRLPRFEDALGVRKRHHLFCLPSISEGFGMVVIEAMGLGLPVVCSDLPVLREVAGEGAALFFQPDDDADLAEKLARLLTDPALRAEMSRRALAHAAGFSWARLAADVEAVYRQAL